MGKPFDPESYLRRAEQIFQCDVHHLVHAKRLSGAEKEIRDLMLYGIWKTGQFKNEQVGNLFGISYSGVSHALRSAKITLLFQAIVVFTLAKVNVKKIKGGDPMRRRFSKYLK